MLHFYWQDMVKVMFGSNDIDNVIQEKISRPLTNCFPLSVRFLGDQSVLIIQMICPRHN